MKLDLAHVPTSNGSLAVLCYEPRRARGVAIVAGHGYSSSKHNLDALCAFLAAHGFALYSLDFPGHKLGASGGRLNSIDDGLAAFAAAIAFARTQGNEHILTLGHSMGAMCALFAASADTRILGTVAIATGFGRPTAIATLQRAGASDFRSGYVDGISLPELVQSVDARYERALPLLAGRHALYIAAERDSMVAQSSVRELYERAPDEKTYRTIESDHTEAATNARSTVLSWLDERFARA